MSDDRFVKITFVNFNPPMEARIYAAHRPEGAQFEVYFHGGPGQTWMRRKTDTFPDAMRAAAEMSVEARRRTA